MNTDLVKSHPSFVPDTRARKGFTSGAASRLARSPRSVHDGGLGPVMAAAQKVVQAVSVASVFHVPTAAPRGIAVRCGSGHTERVSRCVTDL